VRAGTWDDSPTTAQLPFVCRFASPPKPRRLGPFSFVHTAKAWRDAEAHCVNTVHGHLASIHTPEENEQVHELCRPDKCWIGYNDVAQEGTWVWSDGSTPNFGAFPGAVAPWNPGQPDNQGWFTENSDAAYMFPTTNHWVRAGTWDDSPTSQPLPFLCRSGGAGHSSSGNAGAAVGITFLVVFLVAFAGGGMYAAYTKQAEIKAWVEQRVGSSPPLVTATTTTVEPSSYAAPYVMPEAITSDPITITNNPTASNA